MFFTAARHGGRGGRPFRPLTHVRARLWLVALVLACAAIVPAQAGSMYRCVGASGETVFTSSRAGYRHCRTLHLAPVRTAPAPVPPAAKTGGHGAKVADAAKPRKHDATKAAPVPASPRWQYRQGTADRAPKLSGTDVPKGARVLRGAVYKVEHADGSIEYTNVRPRGRSARGASTRTLFTYIATCVACNVHSGIDWAHVPLRLDVYARTIRTASAKYGVDPALVRAVIHAESAFNPRAVSAKGAQGLMQLMPSTASDMGVDNAFDARQNIRGGARYLAKLLKTFHGDARLAAAAYNAGPDAVQKYGGVPPYAETRVYVHRVTLLHRRYRQAMRHQASVASGGPGRAD
jgi:soluble lytic murein transglycosylase-like protein